MLKPGGMLIIHEFHPLLKKAVKLENGTAQLTGDYFSTSIETTPVAVAPFSDTPDILPNCLVRRWTLGAIVTAVVAGGFVIEALLELPEGSTPTLPGSFLLTARLG